jgi:LPXTG-site transpeptidase (sortase) family protein
MTARPWRVVGVLITMLGAVLLTVMMQRGVEADPPRGAAAGDTPAARGSPTLTASTSITPTPTVRTTPSRTASPAAPPVATAPARTTPPSKAGAATAVGLRLRIPAIGLDRAVSGRGLSADGKIDPLPGRVMWFTGYDRVRPGRTGTAVIAGHVVAGGRSDVFADLADVDVGDRVEVVEGGRTLRYTVTSARAVRKQALTTDQAVWGANSSESRLAIITCDDALGFRGDGHRVANFVVIAEPG